MKRGGEQTGRETEGTQHRHLTVGTDLRKQNGKQSDHLFESVMWDILEECTCQLMRTVPLSISSSFFHPMLLTPLSHLTVIVMSNSF